MSSSRVAVHSSRASASASPRNSSRSRAKSGSLSEKMKVAVSDGGRPWRAREEERAVSISRTLAHAGPLGLRRRRRATWPRRGASRRRRPAPPPQRGRVRRGPPSRSDAVQSVRMCASCSRRIVASRLRWSAMVRSCSKKNRVESRRRGTHLTRRRCVFNTVCGCFALARAGLSVPQEKDSGSLGWAAAPASRAR